eukprot:PhF_6_TR21942/c0_g1_i2/m.31186
MLVQTRNSKCLGSGSQTFNTSLTKSSSVGTTSGGWTSTDQSTPKSFWLKIHPTLTTWMTAVLMYWGLHCMALHGVLRSLRGRNPGPGQFQKKYVAKSGVQFPMKQTYSSPTTHPTESLIDLSMKRKTTRRSTGDVRR